MSLERSVKNAIAKLDEVLDRHLWMVPGVRDSIQEAQDLMKATEAELGSSRSAILGRRMAVCLRDSPLFTLMDAEDKPEEQGANKETAVHDSRQWLFQTFTAADVEAAEGHIAGCETPLNTATSDEESADEDQGMALAGSGSWNKSQGLEMGRRRSQNNKDIVMSAEEMEAQLHGTLGCEEVVALLKAAGTVDFDALAFGALPAVRGKPCQVLAAYTLQESAMVRTLRDAGKVPEAIEKKFSTCLLRFLGEIDSMYYVDAPYHSRAHAADVMMTMEWMLKSDFLQTKVSVLDHLMVMVASAIHDVAHPSRNNLFLVKTMNPMAMTYNDKAVLENMHIAKSFELMTSNRAYNWFALLPREYRRPSAHGFGSTLSLPEKSGDVFQNLQQYVRRGLIDMVLATDMAKHAETVKKLDSLVEAELQAEQIEPITPRTREKRGSVEKQEALETKLLLLGTLLHAADIENVCKPRPLMLQWVERVLTEFWEQGDEERRLGVEVSPMCDRESGRLAVPKGQLGFISFVIEPFFKPIAQLMPEVEEAMVSLAHNKAFWIEMDSQQAMPEQIFGAREGDALAINGSAAKAEEEEEDR